VQSDRFGDRERTEASYKYASKRLQEALSLRRKKWETFQIPDLNERDTDFLSQLHQEIEKLLDTLCDTQMWGVQFFTADLIIREIQMSYLLCRREGSDHLLIRHPSS